MRILKKLIFSMITLGLMGNVIAAESNLPSLSQKLQKTLDQTRKQYQFNAMALTVIAPSISPKPLNFVSGTTQIKDGKPLQFTDYFQIGSNTKSFVAALLVKLQSEGLLSLQDPITKWLPQYPKWKNITISNLLHNNSGIQSYSKSDDFFKDFDNNLTKKFTASDLVAFSYKEPVLFKAGQGWDYSNTNWVLAGMIAEKAGKDNLQNLFASHFFAQDKLNLTNTIYWPTAYNKTIRNKLVHGYTNEGKDALNRDMSWANAAGSILASNQDLATWAYGLFHEKALTKNELKFMQQLVSTETGLPVESNQPGYGLGVGLRTIQAGNYWGHEGHTEGFHSIFAYFPKQDVTIAMHSSGLKEADFNKVLDKIMEDLDKKIK